MTEENPTDVSALHAEVTRLREVVAGLEAKLDATPTPAANPAPPSRRDLLRMAGGVAAGAAGAGFVSAVVSAGPAAAATGEPLTVGTQPGPDGGTLPTSGINYTGSGYYISPVPTAVFAITDDVSLNTVLPTAIMGVATKNAAIGVTGVGSFYDFVAAGTGLVHLVAFMTQGPPTAGDWLSGDLLKDEHGNLFACVVSGTPGTWRKLAGPAAAGAFHAISPQRVYDSRGTDGPIADGQERIVSVATSTAGTPVVPLGATAVAITLTVTNTQGAGGFLAVRPAGTLYAGTSSINWFGPGQNLAATVISQLGGDRQLTVRGGFQPADFLIDVTGYYA